jgi:hypothetical protein
MKNPVNSDVYGILVGFDTCFAEKEGTLSRKIQYSFNPYIQVNILLNPIQSID